MMKEIKNEQAIVVFRGRETLDAVDNVSNYINQLPLNQSDNDKLLNLLTIMLVTAEREQYLKGFSTGIKFLNDEQKGLK